MIYVGFLSGNPPELIETASMEAVPRVGEGVALHSGVYMVLQVIWHVIEDVTQVSIQVEKVETI